MFCLLYLQCTLRYGLDSTIVGSKITLIMCSSFLVQGNNLKQQQAALLPCLIVFMRIS